MALFLSTLSLRRATTGYPLDIPEPKHFYPRSPCGERRPRLSSPLWGQEIFYPRSPCGERRESIQRCIDMMSFLSTLSLRRATVPYHERSGAQCFSIHALLAESDPRRVGRQCTRRFFYPRSPCGERRCISRSTPVQAAFLSTLSLRRATESMQDRPEEK